jgi:hypothetical protein
MPLDELEFPGTVPFLELLLTYDRGGHVVMHLKIHQGVYPVRLGESLDQVIPVLPNTLPEIPKDVYRRLALNYEYLLRIRLTPPVATASPLRGLAYGAPPRRF